MSLPLIRLAIGRTNGTAHYGVLLDATQPLAVCATHSPALQPIGEDTAHTLCQSWGTDETRPVPPTSLYALGARP